MIKKLNDLNESFQIGLVAVTVLLALFAGMNSCTITNHLFPDGKVLECEKKSAG